MSAGMIPDSLKKLGGKIGGTPVYPDAIVRDKYAAKTPTVKTGGFFDNFAENMDSDFLAAAAASANPKRSGVGGLGSVNVGRKTNPFEHSPLNVSPLQGSPLGAAPSAYKKRLLPHAAQEITYG